MVTRLTDYTKQFWSLLSTDDTDPLVPHNGDEAILIDRNERYVFDEENQIWRHIPMSGGGGGTLTTKTITENGTYSAEDDNADGYSSVTVNVPSNADENLIKRITNTLTSFNVTQSEIGYAAFKSCSNLTLVTFPNTITLLEDCFCGCGMSTVHLHTATLNGYNIFREMPNLTTFVVENAILGTRFYYLLYSCPNLTTIDIGGSFEFKNDCITAQTKKVDTIILRSSTVVPLYHVSNLTNQDAFKSGGTGGTVYIPKVLYDHLGDGSSLDYQAATNWSTVHGYGTITWAKIEGSIYETQYADGKPITTT